MKLPSQIWQFKGSDQNGPNILILGGTHGDEYTGIEIVKSILQTLKAGNPGIYERDDIIGNLFIGFGNPKAIEQGTRGTRNEEGINGRDLNRSFDPEELNAEPKDTDRADLTRARELIPLLEQIDVLIDLHSTSSKSEPFVCFQEDTPRHRNIYKLFPIKAILTDPTGIYMLDSGIKDIGATDDYVSYKGGSAWGMKKYGKKQGTGLCYETGWTEDLSNLNPFIIDILRILKSLNSVNKPFINKFNVNLEENPKIEQTVYQIFYCPITKATSFTYKPGMQTGWQEVKKGQVVGTYPNGEKEIIPEDGMYIFPRAEKRIIKGLNLYTLAKPIAKVD